MRWIKSMFLLIVANILIFLALVISGNILIYFVLPALGIDVRGHFASSQLAWSMVFGFGGAFISLWMSKTIAKRGMRMQQVVQPSTPKEALVFNTVRELSARAGIRMPEVWVYWDETPNAFATGPTRNRAMVAVSSGLVNNLTDDEVRAVLAHEIGHVVNGDMLSMTLLQGLMNTFVYFLASMIARAVASAGSREGGMNYGLYFIVDFVLQMLLSILALIVICWFSRRREFRADAFSARIFGPEAMIAALSRLEAVAAVTMDESEIQPEADPVATMKIYNPGRFMHLFATHPPIEARIEALRGMSR